MRLFPRSESCFLLPSLLAMPAQEGPPRRNSFISLPEANRVSRGPRRLGHHSALLPSGPCRVISAPRGATGRLDSTDVARDRKAGPEEAENPRNPLSLFAPPKHLHNHDAIHHHHARLSLPSRTRAPRLPFPTITQARTLCTLINSSSGPPVSPSHQATPLTLS